MKIILFFLTISFLMTSCDKEEKTAMIPQQEDPKVLSAFEHLKTNQCSGGSPVVKLEARDCKVAKDLQFKNGLYQLELHCKAFQSKGAGVTLFKVYTTNPGKYVVYKEGLSKTGEAILRFRMASRDAENWDCRIPNQ